MYVPQKVSSRNFYLAKIVALSENVFSAVKVNICLDGKVPTKWELVSCVCHPLTIQYTSYMDCRNAYKISMLDLVSTNWLGFQQILQNIISSSGPNRFPQSIWSLVKGATYMPCGSLSHCPFLRHFAAFSSACRWMWGPATRHAVARLRVEFKFHCCQQLQHVAAT